MLYRCPHCSGLLTLVAEHAGVVVICPHCRGNFLGPNAEPRSQFDATPDSVPPPPIQVIATSPAEPPVSNRSHQATRGPAVLPLRGESKHLIQSGVRGALVGAVIGAVVGGGIGFGLSQFWPFYGGFLVALAEPFSPARLQVAFGHVLIVGGLGGLVGGFFVGGICIINSK